MSIIAETWSTLRHAPHTISYVLRHPIGARQPLRTYARFLRWQITSRVNPGLRAVTWVGGAQVLARRSLTGVTGNIYYGLHEFWEMAFVVMSLRENDLFADVGANAGTYSILASKVAGARTIAFEPNADIREICSANLKLNGITDRVSLHPEAIGDHVGTVSFTTGLGTMNHIVDDGQGETVPLTTIDTTFAGRVPTVIKLDIEGGEARANPGARATLAADGLQALLIETVDEGIEKALVEAGLRECRFDPFERKLELAREKQRTHNRLFVRHIDEMALRIAGAPALDVHGIIL